MLITLSGSSVCWMRGKPQTCAMCGAAIFCDISLHLDPRTGTLIVVSALDNMVKGAAGQAVQNMNLLFGLPEDTGLHMIPTCF